MTSSDADFDVRLGDAVEIASAGDEEVALLGQVQILGGLAGGVGAVVYLDAARSGFFQLPKQRAQAFRRCSDPGRMGEDRQAAGFANPPHRLDRLRQLAIDEGGTPIGQVSIEGILGRGDEFLFHQQARDVGAADGFRPGQCAHLVIGDGNAQLVEALNDFGIRVWRLSRKLTSRCASNRSVQFKK